jgi:hypothetical protein
MRFRLILASALFLQCAAAVAGTTDTGPRWRLAASSADACLANCESSNASCKRVCPTTLSTPCISSCDSQAQTCRQSCRGR